MFTTHFDYTLPPDRIAQRPADPRDSSRLMVLERRQNSIRHCIFRDLIQFLRPKDVLVLNETRVIPARLNARKIPTGGRVELLLLKRLKSQVWEVLVGGRGLSVGRMLQLKGKWEAEILKDLGGARRIVGFSAPISPSLEELGEMPLPPYIHTPLQRPDEYQTVFSRNPGSVAAPTAGLHFTAELLKQIETCGVKIVKITLHVGLDTFAPMKVEDPKKHIIHTEWCQVTPSAAETINSSCTDGGRIIAVGTTTVRTLESAARFPPPGKRLAVFEGPTDLYILPGYSFKAVDAMITNFHLPRSTLLMMVCAFAGRENILSAYDVALREDYRFYSFGDAQMLL